MTEIGVADGARKPISLNKNIDNLIARHSKVKLLLIKSVGEMIPHALRPHDQFLDGWFLFEHQNRV